MVNFENDYKFGEQEEERIHKTLEKRFGTLTATGRWEKHDFKNDRYNIEVKSRKCNYSTYPTTMMTCNKVVEEENKKLYFVFNFRDGIYYIRYRPALFSTFEQKKFSRINETFDEKMYYYIPIQLLKKIEPINAVATL